MLHPIKALDYVIEEYRDYLLTEFRAKDPNLKAALERELDRSGFLCTEPFFQAHRPFRSEKKWGDLPIDPKLAKVMTDRARSERCYVHQSEAISHLLGSDASAIVVTTGTGSGKTECFLLPVIQNAIDDATRYKKSGLTAILLYPMNALANDQEQRINDYLESSGFSGVVKVAKYDRGTKQSDREALRRNPPHILLTNYMMLEYLLVRPADREDIFANHRCRFLVLDEVHTYRGTLGSNIALLVRRLKAHLARAKHDWKQDVPDAEKRHRFPELLPIGTSATIRSVDETGLSEQNRKRARDEAVQEFFSKITGEKPQTIKVLGEELEDIRVPAEATYSLKPPDKTEINLSDTEAVRKTLCKLAGIDEGTLLAGAASRCRILWDFNTWLIRKPMSIGQLAEKMKTEIAARRDWNDGDLRKEAEIALRIGAALPEGTPGALRLRAHRFIRGGWKFYRCVNPECGRLYPKGEEMCECGHRTAPLYLCRNCGADYLRFTGDEEAASLRPSGDHTEPNEWLVYQPDKFGTPADVSEDEEVEGGRTSARAGQPTQIKKRPVLNGSFDPKSLLFSPDENEYKIKVTLAPARTRCLCCYGTAGSKSVLTPVSLGTSAAVKVLSEGLVETLGEANKDRKGHDGKERLLIFSDSRQDASHQARFIIFASRYDRMRRRVARLLAENGPMSIQRIVEELGQLGIENNDNPYIPISGTDWIPQEDLKRIRTWEEAPLLDELAVNAGYRASLVNLGIVGVVYEQLTEYVQRNGSSLLEKFGFSVEKKVYLLRCLLDEIRIRGCLDRELLRYHPSNSKFPLYLSAAEWERRIKQPAGYAADSAGRPIPCIDSNSVPVGITARNVWRREKAGGKSPSVERIFRNLIARFGGPDASQDDLIELLEFLCRGGFLKHTELHGARDRIKLLQVNSNIVTLVLTNQETRCRCEICSTVVAGAQAGLPCPKCRGTLIPLSDEAVEESRWVRRINKETIAILSAGEHTAQVTNDERLALEEKFKSSNDVSRLNLLACSPTLEMGIDVGGLDAIILRNIPPRPDNYAQRGGRAGRRLRIGLVVGYARSTPHDQYFYENPEEMIAGEVPVPALTLGNRDVVIRHLNAIVFGAAEPGLAGKMVEYVSQTGEIKHETVTAFIEGIKQKFQHGIDLALQAWGKDILSLAGLDEKDFQQELMRLPEKIIDIVERTSRQVKELRNPLDVYAAELGHADRAVRAGNLVKRLLGISESQRDDLQADDRSAGYPLRRFAEFGLLPGYEFPSEPSSLRLLGDAHEMDPVATSRRFGIGQFEPGAHVYARAKRWTVIGLDKSSPWNPHADDSGWQYRKCNNCKLRYSADKPKCPRCGTDLPGRHYTGVEYAGFLARRDESPVLDEEERFASKNHVVLYPQWDGDVIARWTVGNGWGLRLSREETVVWLNEGGILTEKDRQTGLPVLHEERKGHLLCSSCGKILTMQDENPDKKGGRKKTRTGARGNDPYGHAAGCEKTGLPGRPAAIICSGKVEILRMMAPLPDSMDESVLKTWGLTLGYSLLAGMKRFFAMDEGDLDFEFEDVWTVSTGEINFKQACLTFIDPNIGGSGYLSKIAEKFDRIAESAVEHLNHADCESACYRCLKTYSNQRYHEYLQWPSIMGDLETLSGSQPQVRPLQTGDIDDPKPWLEAYAAGVGSPLELKFLRLFEQNGLIVQKQVLVAPSDDSKPISIADFVVENSRVCIYIDGASFHVGERLRRDRFIREKLRKGNPPWKVVELRAADIGKGASLVKEIKALSE